MGTREGLVVRRPAVGRKSGFGGGAKAVENLEFSRARVGQSYPQQYPYPAEPLGEPMDIRQVAGLLGCSTWSVRQRYLPSGLPHFRLGRNGRLRFYRNQVVSWVLEKQHQKGGRL